MRGNLVEQEVSQPATVIGGAMSVRSRNQILADYYRRYKRDLRAYIYAEFDLRFIDPEDVIQQVFMKFAELKNLHEIKTPRAFLLRMAYHIIISAKRRHKVREKYADLVGENYDSWSDGREITPERTCEGREQLNIVVRTIEKMPHNRRCMLLLRRINDLTYVEIARRFEVSQTCVKKHVARATRDLHEVLL